MTDHDQSLLGPYVLGVLEPGDVREVEEHLPGCADCRQQLAELEEMKELLGDVPPEAFLDGPPPDGDLLLQRTLRASRDDAGPTVSPVAAPRRPRLLLVAASAAVIAASALGGGVLIGRQTVDQQSPSRLRWPARSKPTPLTRPPARRWRRRWSRVRVGAGSR